MFSQQENASPNPNIEKIPLGQQDYCPLFDVSTYSFLSKLKMQGLRERKTLKLFQAEYYYYYRKYFARQKKIVRQKLLMGICPHDENSPRQVIFTAKFSYGDVLPQRIVQQRNEPLQKFWSRTNDYMLWRMHHSDCQPGVMLRRITCSNNAMLSVNACKAGRTLKDFLHADFSHSRTRRRFVGVPNKFLTCINNGVVFTVKHPWEIESEL